MHPWNLNPIEAEQRQADLVIEHAKIDELLLPGEGIQQLNALPKADISGATCPSCGANGGKIYYTGNQVTFNFSQKQYELSSNKPDGGANCIACGDFGDAAEFGIVSYRSEV